ncbi:MAG: non-canonical purine NTP diphosphatase [Paludibacteraceae bacterium]|nr:non-canonical purine NTP diphosphatase [Paludibacteraceae bacterium]MBN2787300.1 non-canonical purine NTP diphosphatase [Paludibacteraceae bacterium]
MKKEIVFATNNLHKLDEVLPLLAEKYTVLSLNDIGCTEEIPETADTLEGNALLKAQYIYTSYGKNCFADDTGLEVEALDNAPGVYSARYAGEEKSAEANMHKLLQELNGKTNRNARFRTAIALIIDGENYIFEGEVTGKIIENKRGTKGFGYDPLFIPTGYNQTFAEIALSEKNKISHRAKAVQKLITFLENYKK